jgi:hypothetical protein
VVLSTACGRAWRCAGVAVIAGMLALAAPALASNPSPSGGVSFIPGLPTSNLANPTPANSNNPTKATTSSKQLGYRVLREGMRGHDVRILQTYLTVVGYGTMVDGIFGPQTKGNVTAFQRTQRLTPNGIVSFALARLLRNKVARIQSMPASGTTRINPDGTATAPAGAPSAVLAVVSAANQIIDTSYCYAGGHGSWESSCYDCSGAVSYALHGGGLLTSPEAIQLESYGDPGPGRWITVYADAEHVFMVVAGRAFDTADYGGPNIPAGSGPRWRSDPLGNLADGGNYVVRHPPGL